MSNPSESLPRIQGSHSLSIKLWCDNHKKELLITIVAIAAIGTIIVGVLTLLASSHAGLNGLNALGTPGGASFVAVGGVALLLTVLRACYFYKQNGNDTRRIIPESPREESEKQKAATKIQSVYRGHIARLALKKREEAAITLQSAYRAYLAQSQLKILQKQAAQSTPEFSAYITEIFFNHGKETIPIRNKDDIESMVKRINDEIYQKHGSISIYFEGCCTSRERKERMECFEKIPSATNLQFIMPAYSNFLRVQAKPIKVEELGNGKVFRTFANGITETFISEGEAYKGTRVFPDGEQETGKFDKNGAFRSGYRIGQDQQIEFQHPESFVSYANEFSKIHWHICEFEEKLVTLKNAQGNYAIASNVSVKDVLIQASLRAESKYEDGRHIGKVLSHKSFEIELDQFIKYALENMRLFEFSNAAIIDVLEASTRIRTIINPLEIIDPVSKRNIFVQAAHWGSAKLLNKLIELFPQAFATTAQECVAEFLLQGHSLLDSDKLLCAKIGEKSSFYYDFLERAKLDPYHSMWLQVAICGKPNEKFKREFALLSPEKKRTFYDAAFTYANPFIYESPDLPIRADQYSINLMWINKSKMPVDQEYLFDDECAIEQEFIISIAKWAKKNPGSSINIWVDGEMATPRAITKFHEALQKVLEDSTSHGAIYFRDVRSIEVVRDNAAVFNDKMPIYFRVDLLRAIAADYVLRNKETQYFVYGDIDMKPLSGQQLFDKRTVKFLDDFGIVMAKGGHLGFENGFQILNGDNRQCMDSHRQVIIDLSIEMALECPEAIKKQQIYDTYPAMITHFLDADGRYGKLNLDKEQQTQFGANVFRYDRFGSAAHLKLPLENTCINLRDIMPRKPVRLPSSHF